jgi:DMSO/TMAO reductase YedYZ heme-binding membrane subunit
MPPSTGFSGPNLVYVAIVGFGVMCGLALLPAPGSEEGIRLAIRLTARTTLAVFAVVFCTSALRRRWPGPKTNWLMRNRRYLGLSAAVSHGYHLIFILWLAGTAGLGDTDMVTIVGGGWGFVLLAAMAATSNDASQRRLRANWRRLHLLGVWTTWIIYAVSYWPGVLLGENVAVIPIVGSIVVLASLLLRVWPLRQSAAAGRMDAAST